MSINLPPVGTPPTKIPELPWEAICPSPYSLEDVLLVKNNLCEWAQDLHRILAAQNSTSSTCFSPASITPVLGMIMLGLNNEAQKEMMTTLGIEHLSPQQFHRILGELCQGMCSKDEDPFTLRSANALACKEHMADTVKAGYRLLSGSYYDAKSFALSNGPEATDEVNQWVSEKTNGMINQLLDAGSANSAFAFILNAVYFKGTWSSPFSADQTCPKTFHCVDGSESPCLMMHKEDVTLLHQDETCQMVELSYNGTTGQGDRLSCVVFLPAEGSSLHDLEGHLSSDMIARCRKNATHQYTRLALPKLDISFKTDDMLELLDAQGLPVKEMMNEFSESTEIGSIVHQSILKVNEEGAEGAAATAAGIRCTYVIETEEFIADRPFVLMIMAGDNVLFQASIRDGSAMAS